MSMDSFEKYEFTWNGKKAALARAKEPSRKTFCLCREEMLSFPENG